jgi:hypothetical protein
MRMSKGRLSVAAVRHDGVRPVLADRVAEYPWTTYGGVDWTPDGAALVFPAIEGGRVQLSARVESRGSSQPTRFRQDLKRQRGGSVVSC